MKNIFQQGDISIFIAILLLSQLLVIGLGVSFLILNQLKMSVQTSQSVLAFYAADSGAERCLLQVRKATGTGCDDPDAFPSRTTSGTLTNGSSYTAEYFPGLRQITSIGRDYSQKTTRKVEVTWP